MKRCLVLLVVGITITGLVTLAGCDDDDNGTGPDFQMGDTMDIRFQLARGVILGDDGWSPFAATDTTIFLIIDLLDTVLQECPAGVQWGYDVPGLSLQEPYLLTYNPESQYWYRYAEVTLDSFELVWEDSIQLVTAAGPVQCLDTAELVSLNIGSRVISLVNLTDTLLNIGQQVSLTGDILTLGDVVLNGAQTVSGILALEFDTSATVCRIVTDATTNLNSIAMNLTDIAISGLCPTGGQLIQDVMLDVFCIGDTAIDFGGGWRLVETFSADSVEITFENGNTRWTFAGECPAVVTATPSHIPWSDLRR